MVSNSDSPGPAPIPYDALAVDLVRHLRGRWSPAALSRRLGYASNVVYTWESGRRSPTASRFFAAARRLGIDVDGPSAEFVRAELPPIDTPAGVAALVAAAVRDQPIAAVAARAGCSRHQLSRWVHGTTEPRLPDLLRALDGATLAVLDWVAGWADPAQLPSVAPIWRALSGARELSRASPWTSAVLLALGLTEYQALAAHEPGWIARRLGIPEDLEASCLDVLCAAGLVHRAGRRYVPAPRPPVELRGARPRSDLKEFWSRAALERLDRGYHAWNLFSVSAEAYERIEALHRKFYADLRREVDASDGRGTIAVAVVHLVPLG